MGKHFKLKESSRMHSEICEKPGIEFPIFAFSHCRDVVAAVSKAGGIGVLGALAFSPEELEMDRLGQSSALFAC